MNDDRTRDEIIMDGLLGGGEVVRVNRGAYRPLFGTDRRAIVGFADAVADGLFEQTRRDLLGRPVFRITDAGREVYEEAHADG